MAVEVEWQVCTDADAVAADAARQILAAARQAIARHERFRLVLAGGATPQSAYRRLAAADEDWSRWELFFGDERCLPVGDGGRNDTMAGEAWLDRVALAPAQIYPIPAELGAEKAATAYAETVRSALPFDLVLLGMGEDGHTASLFPSRSVPDDALTVAVHAAPKPPPERVSLGQAALNATPTVLILVTGAAKRPAVARWRRGEDLPVARIRGRRSTRVLIDRAAWPGDQRVD